MNWIVLIFPLALIAALGLFFVLEYLPLARAGFTGPEPLRRGEEITRFDRLAALIITAVYAAAAFTGLGVNTAPQSFCHFTKSGEYALIDLGGERWISTVMYYTGLYTGSYRLQLSSDGETWADQGEMEQKHGDLFKWRYAELNDARMNAWYIRITANGQLDLGEIAVRDENGELIPAESMSFDAGTAPLLDEQDTVPDAPSYLNSAYFDEIYHARTAYEHINNIKPYEVSHPPLGKLIISLGIRLFGMTPFGWRFMGTLFGAAMLPALYVFLKKMLRSSRIAVCCTVIFAFDFMHFVQTRIATIDTYAVFFIILMYLFMYRYVSSPRLAGGRRREWLVPLALSGLFFGLGAASKWTCIYAGAGLAVIWLVDRVERGVVLCRAGEGRRYARETAGNILWCLLFFVAVPCVIYYLSYWPYGTAAGLKGPGMLLSREYLDIVLENQRFMFTYHAGVTATHPYSSRWYQWVLDIRPILYYLDYSGDGLRSSFGAFLSPLLCWGGLLSMCAMVYMTFWKRDKRARFILIGYLAQLLPWVFISRVTFEYHYFPSAVFLTLALGHVLTAVLRLDPERRRLVYAFPAVSVVLFAAFYPVLTGVRIDPAYAKYFLCWIPGWWPF